MTRKLCPATRNRRSARLSNGMTQTSSGDHRGHQNLDGICQAVHEYALGQRPLFGMWGLGGRGVTSRRVAGQGRIFLRLCGRAPLRPWVDTGDHALSGHRHCQGDLQNRAGLSLTASICTRCISPIRWSGTARSCVACAPCSASGWWARSASATTPCAAGAPPRTRWAAGC